MIADAVGAGAEDLVLSVRACCQGQHAQSLDR